MALGTRGSLRFDEEVQSIRIDKHNAKATTMCATSQTLLASTSARYIH